MAAANKNTLSPEQHIELLTTLKTRFDKNTNRHKGIQWADIETKLLAKGAAQKLWSLYEMEKTGGEPDVIGYDKNSNEYVFFDCVAESPKERRSYCYDQEALQSRKENKPKNSAVGAAEAMGIELLTETEYRTLQQFGKFDTKTSSWIKTPVEIRKLGGAIFADFRYGHVFVYHNGAESYYAARGFRGSLRL